VTIRIGTGDPMTVELGTTEYQFGHYLEVGPAPSYTIVSLPSEGTLSLRGGAVSAGEVIDASDLGLLTYSAPAAIGLFGFEIAGNDGLGLPPGVVWFAVSPALSTAYVGTDGSDVIDGGGGNDLIDGRGGADLMIGGAGNDVMKVDCCGDAVSEIAGGGTDTVLASVSFDLSNGRQAIGAVENVTLTGSAAANAIGNELANVLIGNSGPNHLRGDGGDDTLAGAQGNDRLFGGNGSDKLAGGDGNDRLAGGDGSDTLAGDAGDDWLAGGNGSDTLAGGPGHNRLAGGSGDDTLVGGAGYDRAGGGNGNDTLVGGLGNDWLAGGPGNDRVAGGLGHDQLAGGGGNDTFVFDTTPGAPSNYDRILDFRHGQDHLALDHRLFSDVAAQGHEFNADAFFAGTLAHDADDRIVYEQATGRLSYDANGDHAGGAVLIALIANHPMLTAGDFTVI
jgi:Ca2+-binding RTX toxin-like protein